jgi:hypothetical protein
MPTTFQVILFCFDIKLIHFDFKHALILCFTYLNAALTKFIEQSGLENELKLAVPDSPFAETEEENCYFFLDNLKKLGFSEEYDKQVQFSICSLISSCHYPYR